jgi:hypothetical protein
MLLVRLQILGIAFCTLLAYSYNSQKIAIPLLLMLLRYLLQTLLLAVKQLNYLVAS